MNGTLLHHFLKNRRELEGNKINSGINLLLIPRSHIILRDCVVAEIAFQVLHRFQEELVPVLADDDVDFLVEGRLQIYPEEVQRAIDAALTGL